MSTKCTEATMIESRGHELSASRSRVYSSMLVSLILTLNFGASAASNNSNSLVGKCCPCGQVISAAENFTCAFAKDRSTEIYQFADHDHHVNFTFCPSDANLIITNLEENMELNIRALNACVDLLSDREYEQSIPIIFQCLSNRSNEDDALSAGNLVVPKIPTLRMCCGIDQVYDVETRDCVFKNKGLNVPKTFGFFDKVFDFITIVRGPPICEYAIVDYMVNVTRDVHLHSNGTLEVVLTTKNGTETIMANENNTCLDHGNLSSDLVVVRACSGSSFCKENACVRKCCSEDRSFVGTQCAKTPSEMRTGTFHEFVHNATIAHGSAKNKETLNTTDYGLLIGKPCKYGMFPVEEHDDWHITPRGYVDLLNYRIYEHNDYCMEIFFDNLRSPNNFYSVVCFDNPEAPDDSPTRFQINAGLELASCTFLIITLLVYICLPVLRNLHGKTLMCHVISLIVAYGCLAAIAIGTPPSTGIKNSEGTKICQFLGFTALLALHSAFSWLNVMCFDIWWTFGGLGSAVASGSRGRAYKKRFLMYSLYAWGFALFITCVGVLADRTEFLPYYMRPNIAVNSCWFERNYDLYGEMIFFIGPVCLQLIANIAFFVMTARYCSKVKAEITKVMATPSDPRNRRYRADRTKFIMNIKLFIVMGVSWIFEVVSFFINHYAVGLVWRAEFFWASDAFNCLQGVMIFILFVLKKKVYYALLRRMGRGKGSTTVPPSKGANGLQDPFRMSEFVTLDAPCVSELRTLVRAADEIIDYRMLIDGKLNVPMRSCGSAW